MGQDRDYFVRVGAAIRDYRDSSRILRKEFVQGIDLTEDHLKNIEGGRLTRVSGGLRRAAKKAGINLDEFKISTLKRQDDADAVSGHVYRFDDFIKKPACEKQHVCVYCSAQIVRSRAASEICAECGKATNSSWIVFSGSGDWDVGQ